MNAGSLAYPHLLTWITRRLGLYALMAYSILVGCMGCVAYSLSIMVQQMEAGYLTWICGLSLVLGWSLGSSRLKSWTAALLALLFGGAWIGYFPGRLSIPFSLWLAETKIFLGQAWYWAVTKDHPSPESEALRQASQNLIDQAGLLLGLISGWIGSLISGRGSYDPFVSMLVWGALLGAVAVWAGWCVRRREQAFLAIFPAGGMLAAVINYSGGNPYIMLLFLGLALLLVIIVNHHARERVWERNQIDYPLEARLDLAFPSVPLLVIILLAAALAPSITLQNLTRAVQAVTGKQSAQIDTVGETLGLKRINREEVPGLPSPGGLPQGHLPGSGPELNHQTVMYVRTGELPPLRADLLKLAAPHHYWRSLTYERYTGRGWVQGEVNLVDYKAGSPARYQEEFEAGGEWTLPPGFRLITQEVELTGPSNKLLYAAGSLVGADQDYSVAWRTPEEQASGEPGGGDVFAAIIQEEKYQVKSIEARPGLQDLAEAGTDYPPWILSHYLSLPTTLPGRLISLTFDVTAGATNPYERAKAIEAFLRQYPYSLDLPMPPHDRDLVDYFIFDLQRGYCDYYATAMVVMARAAGLPARLVIGYAAGEYDYLQARYIVRQSDAHSWVEIYFAGIGWVAFEPTANRPEISYPGRAQPTHAAAVIEALGFPTTEEEARVQPLNVVGTVLVVVSLLLAGFFVARHRLRKGSEPDRLVVDIYNRLWRRGHPITEKGQQYSPLGATPNEFGHSLVFIFTGLAGVKAVGRVMQPVIQDVETLVELYNLAVFSPRRLGLLEGQAASKAWGRLGWRLWAATVLIRNRKLKQP
jgi:transglutaminase-like putative cysteine protease